MIVDPDKIRFEGSHFLIYDLSKQLPRHGNFPFGSSAINPNTKTRDVNGAYHKISSRKIDTIVTHQTAGGYGAADIQVYREAQFFIKDPEWKPNPKWGKPKQPEFVWTGRGRGWPGFAYTWYVPFHPFVHPSRSGSRKLFVIYQCNDLDWVTWHTGSGMNSRAGGLAFQGYFLEPEAGVKEPIKGTDGEPSEEQMIILDTFWPEYANAVLGATTLTGHWEHGKAACPGKVLRERVIELRGYQ